MIDGGYAIKVRFPNEKRFNFLTPRGGETRLRIHAALNTEEKMNEKAHIIREDNPGVEVKVIKMWKD